MSEETKTITLPLPYGMGSVNCYLIETSCPGHGSPFLMADLERQG